MDLFSADSNEVQALKTMVNDLRAEIERLEGEIKKKSKFKTLHSSHSPNWETPPSLFKLLSEEFGPFQLDAACSRENCLCRYGCTKTEMIDTAEDRSYSMDGLKQTWFPYERVWLNPPYGRGINKWMKKCVHECAQGAFIVTLIAARTDTKWWQEWVTKASEIRLIKGRLSFQDRTHPDWREDGSHKVVPAPFPSAVVIFNPAKRGQDCKIVHWDWRE